LISIAIFVPIIVLSWIITAWALAYTARKLGSSRGRFVIGLAVCGVVLSLQLMVAYIQLYNASRKSGPTPWLGAVLLLINLLGMVYIYRTAFAISISRAFALLGVSISIGVIELVIAILVVRPYLVEAFFLPTMSMAPTLNAGERLMVEKLTTPLRFDVIVYRDRDSYVYCRRVIGLPGDTLEFSNGSLIINGQPADLPPVLAGRCHAVIPGPFGRFKYVDDEPIKLGPNEVFLMGDNVDRSRDSRLDGPYAISSIIGVVEWTYWPLNKIRIVR
jgi:signal peptidase I